MNKKALISAILLSNPAAFAASDAVAEARALSLDARAELLGDSFSSEKTFAWSNLPESRLVLTFAKVGENLPVSGGPMDFEVIVSTLDVGTGTTSTYPWYYFAKATDVPGQYKLYNCDSTATCGESDMSLATISEVDGKKTLEIEDPNAVNFFFYNLTVEGTLAFNETK